MNKRFLVIGSNSFSGSSFVDFLLNQKCEVLGVSRSPEPNEKFLRYKLNGRQDNFIYHQIDLNRQLSELVQLVKEWEPEYVVNFSAQGMVAQSWDNPAHWYQTNLMAQVLLHEQLRSLKFIKKYVHVSTPEAYGSTDGWITESFSFSPSTPYAVSRAACDLHLMSFFKAYKFPVCFTRAANVYGPGQQLYRIIPRAMLYARLGKKVQLHGGGHSIRSFIHIDDVADATYRIAVNGEAGESYHISTPDTISIRSLVHKICEMTKVPFSNLVTESEDRLGKDKAYLLDSKKICEQLGWSHQISLDDGLKATLEWVDLNFEILKDLPAEYIHKQ
jgi:dTDP-glucose 4,6-dehydratase